TRPNRPTASTRVATVCRKMGKGIDKIAGPVQLEAKRELALTTKIARFGETLNNVSEKGKPNLLCSNLNDLAGLLTDFYEHCPILSAESAEVRNSRLKLALLTAKTLKLGLDTLGIETVERM
ncbi:MAG TPA: arginine--tRNA ligase, partial [Franconibacter pulveris]|nr:arginine--tRNA ligase [Franconibacter pulveris]